MAGVLNSYVRKTRYDLNETPFARRNSPCPGIQNRRVQTPFLTTKYVLKDNISTRMAIGAIFQLEEQEKVRSKSSFLPCSPKFILPNFDSTTCVTRSFSTPNPNSVSDFKPTPQGNGRLERSTKHLPMSHYEMSDSPFSSREYYRRMNISSINRCTKRLSRVCSSLGIRSCHGFPIQIPT